MSKAKALAEKAIELREKATQGYWVYVGESYSAKDVIMKDNSASWIAHFQPEENGTNNAILSSFAANNITTLSNMLLKCIAALEFYSVGSNIISLQGLPVTYEARKALSELESMAGEK